MTEQDSATNSGVYGETFDKEIENDQQINDGDSRIGEKETEGATENDQSGTPIDRGWAWVVLAACVFQILIYGGMMRSFGVFFLQYQMRFDSNAAETAMMSMIQNITVSTTALFVMTIGLKKFSSRAAVFTGGTFTVVAYLITAFTTDIGVFYFAQGVLAGAGMALIHPPVLAILGVYFKKHRGLANSIFMGGSSVGGLVFAPIVVKLFDEYQYTGALLIISGLLMNIWVSALLLRPIESYSKKKVKCINEDTEITAEDNMLLKGNSDKDDTDATHLKFDEIKLESDIFRSENKEHTNLVKPPLEEENGLIGMQSDNPDMVNNRPQESPLLPRVRAHSVGIRQRKISEDSNRYDSESNIHRSNNVLEGVIKAISRSKVALYTSGEGICGSFIDINTLPTDGCQKNNAAISEEEISDTKRIAVGCCSNMKSCILSVLCTVFDLGLLRNPVFITFLLMAFCIMSGVALVPVYLPTHAKDIGISNEKIGLLISLTAVIDLVSKVTMGVVADRKWIKRSTILVIVAVVLGTMSHLMRFVNSFPTLIIFVVIAGMCCGQYMSMYAVLLMEVIGPEKFKSCLGFGTLVHGTSIAIFFPVAGLLRDITGSYIASFHLLGGLAYLAGVLAFIIPIVKRWEKGKEAEDPLNKI